MVLANRLLETFDNLECILADLEILCTIREMIVDTSEIGCRDADGSSRIAGIEEEILGRENVCIDVDRELRMLCKGWYRPSTCRHEPRKLLIRRETYIFRTEFFFEVSGTDHTSSGRDDEIKIPLRMEDDIFTTESGESQGRAYFGGFFAGVGGRVIGEGIGYIETIEHPEDE